MSELEFTVPEDGSEAALALDFALGALDGAAMRAAELRLRRDPEFSREVAGWQASLAPLAEFVTPVAPPAVVWSAIDRELFRTPVSVEADRPSFWSSLTIWRSLALCTSAVAAVAVGLLVTKMETAPMVVTPRAVVPVGGLLAASMASTDTAKAILITATYDPARGTVILTPAAKDSSRGLTPELWLIVGKDAPRSLGIIDLKGAQSHHIPDALRGRISNGATLAISLEPAGGSPTGAPTGPVVAAGQLSAI